MKVTAKGFAVTLVVLVLVGLLILEGPGIQTVLRQALEWVRGSGWVGVAVFVGLYVAACLLLIPGSLLTLGAGAIYGVGWGFLLVSLASTLGAVAAFEAGRHLARARIQALITGRDRFLAIDRALAREGWKIVVLTRLSPVFPFSLLNYAMGLTGVRFRDYAFASWLGMMPGTLMYVYLGSLAGDLAGLDAHHGRNPLQWALYGVGLAATISVTVVVTRIARQAMDRRLDTEGVGA